MSFSTGRSSAAPRADGTPALRALPSPVRSPPPGPAPRPDPGARRPARGWLGELALATAFYLAYSGVRDLRGTRPTGTAEARRHALSIVHLERALHLFDERAVQRFVLHAPSVMGAFDDFYAIAHFAAVLATLIFLFRGHRQRYLRWRTTLAVITGGALIGFALYPVMPPRLLPARFGIEDTLRVVGGLWNFSSGPVNAISDQYAAMPSLHTAWSLWCAAALVPVLRPWWAKALVGAYPVATAVDVVATGNHYFLDVLAGAALVVVAAGLTSLVAQKFPRRAAKHNRPNSLSLLRNEPADHDARPGGGGGVADRRAGRGSPR